MPANDHVSAHLDSVSKATLKRLEGTDLMPTLRKEMRKATRGIDTKVKRAIRTLPSTTNDKGTDSLRAEVAKSVKRKVRVNQREVLVAIIVVPHGGKSNLARAMEGTIYWTHLDWGRPGSQTLQEPQPAFFEAVEREEPGVVANMVRVLDEFAREI
jgi:hypothetical protein